MKILICGDSWSRAWSVKTPWHSYIGHHIINAAKSGASNQEIVTQFKENYDSSIDLVIVGWSGCTRIVRDKSVKQHKFTHLNEFSLVDDETINFFKNKSLGDILNLWECNINKILKISKVPVIQFSTFGDQPLKKYDNFLTENFLEYLANRQGIFFKHDIPIFEFDWLNNDNLKLTEPFGKKYFPKRWKRACEERERVRPGKFFLGCGHPNEKGHKVWGKFIKEKINDLFE